IADKAEAASEIAALDLARIPLPRTAPGRPAAEPPFENRNESDDVSTLVAALEATPDATERDVAASAQLAYSVPMPRERPPFETILNSGIAPLQEVDTSEVASRAPTVDEVKRIVEASVAMRADVAAAPKAAASATSATSASETLLLAALEAPKAAPAPQAAALPRKIPVPSGKTGRFSKATPATTVAAAAPKTAATPSAIQRRIAMAALVSDPNARATTTAMTRPKADRLVRDVPTAVFTAGFAADPSSAVADRFIGSAVTFLPVAKFQ
ncbi:MAG: hypothetical protein H7Y08_06405, partial [Rhizobiaceae bacterium]|nr:hypothetical protein [Rhizobiaceae bacterium]